MRRRRRRWFAAPLVITSVAAPAACSGGGANQPDWNIYRNGTACNVSTPEHCPRGASCNPPPPYAIECPAEMGDAENVEVRQAGDGSCTMTVTEGKVVATQCPSRSDKPLATLMWTLAPADGGKCTANPQSRSNFAAMHPPVTIDCPLPDGAGIIVRATVDGTCSACAAAPCPGDAPTVPCPPDQPPP